MKVDGYVKPVFLVDNINQYIELKELLEEKCKCIVSSNYTRTGQIQATCTIRIWEWEEIKRFLNELEICN
jgi:hypothetical protein